MTLQEQLNNHLGELNSRCGSRLVLSSSLTSSFRDSTGLNCSVELDEAKEELCLYAEIAEAVAGEHRLWAKALQAAFLGHATRGGGIGLSPDQNRLYLWWRLPMAGLDSFVLEKAIQGLVLSGREMKNHLSEREDAETGVSSGREESWPGLRI